MKNQEKTNINQMATTPSDEQHELERLEQIINTGDRSFVETGQAYERIRSRKLHKSADFKSFAAYCKARWSVGTAQVSRVINGSRIARKVLEKVPALRIQEAHTRPLLRLLKAEQDPEVGLARAVEVLVELAGEMGEVIPPKSVRAKAEEVLPRPPPKRKTPMVVPIAEQPVVPELGGLSALQAQGVEHLKMLSTLLCQIDLGARDEAIRSHLSSATAQLGIVLSRLQGASRKEAA